LPLAARASAAGLAGISNTWRCFIACGNAGIGPPRSLAKLWLLTRQTRLKAGLITISG